MSLEQVLTIAILVEAVVTGIKPIYDKTKGWNLDMLWSLVGGILVCVLSGVDIFKAVQIPLAVPYVGSVLTGIIASRGSNIVHDLIKLLTNFSGAFIIDPLKNKIAPQQPQEPSP